MSKDNIEMPDDDLELESEGSTEGSEPEKPRGNSNAQKATDRIFPSLPCYFSQEF